MLIVQHWEEVTEEFLKEQAVKAQKAFSREKLEMDYWRRNIEEVAALSLGDSFADRP